MSESCESAFQENASVPGVPFLSEPVAEQDPKPAPRKHAITRSLLACTFLLVYLAAYLGAGFAGAKLIDYAWSAIFR
jgi:hypothetical protein